jgi:hypothetical protein
VSFFDRVFTGEIGDVRPPSTPWNLRDYVEAALVGGFPDTASNASPAARRRWLELLFVTERVPELEAAELRVRMHHLRVEGGRHECDLLVEAADGRVVAIEIKCSAAPKSDDARHLAWLRDQLGDRFVAGVVFHTGPRPVPLGDRLFALPISAIRGT